MRMLNDFYCDIDNIMEKQASPYRTHSHNNIKVFFSVILSFFFFFSFLVTNDLEGCLCIAQSNYNIYIYYHMIPVLYVQVYQGTALSKQRYKPSTCTFAVVCFFATAHINNNSKDKKQNTVKCPEQGMTDARGNGDEENIIRNAVENVPSLPFVECTHFLTFIHSFIPPFFCSLSLVS